MKKLIFIIVCLQISLNIMGQECSTCNTRTKFNFKLHKREGLKVDTSLVKTNGVYISEINTNGKTIYTFARFFENGRVYFSCDYCSYPSDKDFNNLKYGSYGYYIIKNGEVKIETFEPYPRYYFVYYKIIGNSIETNGSSKRMKQEPKRRDYTHINRIKRIYIPLHLTTTTFW